MSGFSDLPCSNKTRGDKRERCTSDPIIARHIGRFGFVHNQKKGILGRVIKGFKGKVVVLDFWAYW